MMSRQQAALVVVALAAFAGAQNAKPASNGASVADAATDAVAAGRDHEDPASPQPRRLSSSGIAATDECREFFDAVKKPAPKSEELPHRLRVGVGAAGVVLAPVRTFRQSRPRSAHRTQHSHATRM